MNEISRKPAHTVTESASARQHQGKKTGRPSWSAQWRVYRPEHADEGEDLQLADHRDLGLKSPFCLSRRRPSHGTGTGGTCTRPCLATSRHWLRVVAEESGHRDTVVLLDLGVAEVAGGLAVVERPKAVTEQPGSRPSDEPSVKSISSTRADAVATDEREAHRRRDGRVR